MDKQNAEEAFVFYRSFFEAMESLGDADRLALYDAIARMGLYGEQPKLPLEAQRLFVLIVPQLVANRKKRAEGRKGGRFSKTNGSSEKETSGSENAEPKEKEKEKENEKEKEKDFSFPENAAAAGAEKKETIPSLGEIETYVQSAHLPVDAEHFYNYYEANGWRMGQNPMQDWKAALKAWARNAPVAPRPVVKKAELTDKEIFQQAIEIHRMKEAKQI